MTIDCQKSAPRDLGYRMPAEWEPHRATWLAWPTNTETWPDSLPAVQEIWVEMVRELSSAEQVCLLVGDDRAREEVEGRLRRGSASMDRIACFTIPTVDVWIRDYGPTFLTRKGETPLAFVDWVFNGWGGKYQGYAQDDMVSRELARLLGVPVFEPGIVLEGGSIEVNGRGTCLTTEQCLLHPNRNRALSQNQIEKVLRESLGVRHVVWLGDGIAGDDTDGHIDDIARFVDPSTVVCCVEGDCADENYAALQENLERLRGATDQEGKKLSVVPLPMPGPVIAEGRRLPASYANFYIANGLVLVPTFDHPNDQSALGILTDLFAGRRVVGIPCGAVVPGLGAIHCVTQQEPLP